VPLVNDATELNLNRPNSQVDPAGSSVRKIALLSFTLLFKEGRA